ncbi:MAG: DUF72 domain-containing protein [Candidatus Atribacteria bacterium]|nr:DUF72 domain-containing protein [Candidatus Atribacteria bacterium]
MSRQKSKQDANQKNFIGTSGYYYPGWIGKFYPEGMKSSEFLNYYQDYFDTVELNSTFYHMPKKTTMKTMKRKLKPDFVVSVKMNRTITHLKRLKNVENELRMFFDSVSELVTNLGVILVQLPPSLKLNLEILNNFLTLLPNQFKYAIEFRHKSWLDESVFTLLRDYNVAFVISHGDDYPFLRRETANFSYIRLHGPDELYASLYSESELNEWAEYIKSINEKGVEAFVYFNNDFYGYAIVNATSLKNLLSML